MDPMHAPSLTSTWARLDQRNLLSGTVNTTTSCSDPSEIDLDDLPVWKESCYGSLCLVIGPLITESEDYDTFVND